jgi:hypothetical protein
MGSDVYLQRTDHQPGRFLSRRLLLTKEALHLGGESLGARPILKDRYAVFTRRNG